MNEPRTPNPRRKRLNAVRRRVATVALTLFAGLWVVIFAESQSKASTASVSSPAASSAAASSQSASSRSTASGSSSSSSSALTPVTTSQS